MKKHSDFLKRKDEVADFNSRAQVAQARHQHDPLQVCLLSSGCRLCEKQIPQQGVEMCRAHSYALAACRVSCNRYCGTRQVAL